MATAADLDQELANLAPGAVQAAGEAAVDGVRPRWLVEPATPEAVAAVLGWCSRHGQPVVIRGGGTRMSWGRPPAPFEVLLSTRRLTRITHYEPGDLTVTVEAGLPIERLNEELSRHGQWLPLDVAADGATVGGAVATNGSGPLRHRYGAPRDQLIGIHLATPDGRLAAAGGRVVKNVAGYDLGKLMAGSFGGFAAIVSATFKLAPIPAAWNTLVLTFRDAAAMADAAAAISASQLDPVSVEAEATFGGGLDLQPGFQLLVRFGGPAAVNAEVADAAERLADAVGPIERARVAEDADFWRRGARRHADGAGALVRASWMPASLPAVLALLQSVAHDVPVALAFAGRAAVGSGTIFIGGDPTAQVSVIERLRQRPDALGHVVIARASVDVRTRSDVWGPPSGAATVIQAIKQALDPAGILNANRGPI